MWPRRARAAGAADERKAGGTDDDGGFEQCSPSAALPRPVLEQAAEPIDRRSSAGRGKSGAAGGYARNGFGSRKSLPEEPLSAAQLRMRGIALLARREHSRAELQTKLRRYSEDPELIVQVLDQLQAEKLLSDQRFAEGVARVRGARFGSARVAQDLRAKGVSGELANSLVRDLKATDAERAQAAWQKRFGEAPTDAAERARQMRFLQARGFSPEVIRKVVPRARQAAPDEGED